MASVLQVVDMHYIAIVGHPQFRHRAGSREPVRPLPRRHYQESAAQQRGGKLVKVNGTASTQFLIYRSLTTDTSVAGHRCPCAWRLPSAFWCQSRRCRGSQKRDPAGRDGPQICPVVGALGEGSCATGADDRRISGSSFGGGVTDHLLRGVGRHVVRLSTFTGSN